jgi:hypothetical protein
MYAVHVRMSSDALTFPDGNTNPDFPFPAPENYVKLLLDAQLRLA